jgi:hypothetical protein
MKVRVLTAGAAVVIGLSAAPVAAQERLVHHEFDRNTSATVRVFKTSAGGRIEVETPDLRISKSVAGSTVVTTMRDAGSKDALVLSLDDKALAVTTPKSSVRAARTDREKLERARLLVAGSDVGRRAAALIARLGFGQATPIQPMLLTTRAFILAAAGEGAGPRDVRRSVSVGTQYAPVGAFTVKAGWQEKDTASKTMTPSECWNAYSKEAIAAYIEYEQCMADQAWWDILGQMGCATVYDMRAIGAFSWWLKCVALN